MPVRFNKRITILPWLKANVGKSGISLTIGPKGKTLNIGSTGVSINVSLGKGVGYSKRLITWKKLNILSWLGIGTAAAATKGKSKKSPKDTTELSLDDALNENTTAPKKSDSTEPQEQSGCSWGCAAAGCLVTLIILALIAVIVYLLFRDGSGSQFQVSSFRFQVSAPSA